MHGRNSVGHGVLGSTTDAAERRVASKSELRPSEAYHPAIGSLAREEQDMGEDKDSTKKDPKTNDLELDEEGAAEVTGGREVTEPVGYSHKLGHKHKSKRSSPKRPV
jgi:hypothetical protein